MTACNDIGLRAAIIARGQVDTAGTQIDIQYLNIKYPSDESKSRFMFNFGIFQILSD